MPLLLLTLPPTTTARRARRCRRRRVTSQPDLAVVDEDRVAGARRRRAGPCTSSPQIVASPGDVAGGDRELLARLELDRPVGERLEPDLRPLQVGEDPDAVAGGVGGLADQAVGLLVVGVGRRGSCSAGRRPCRRRRARGSSPGRRRRRAEGADDLGSTHVSTLALVGTIQLAGHPIWTRRSRTTSARRSDDQRARGRRDRGRQRGRAGQEAVHGGGGGAALGDRPDDQRLAAARVAGDEDARRRWWRRRRRARRCRARRARRPSCSSSPACSGPVKPIASSTSSAGISRSVPSTGWNRRQSTSTSRSARTPAVVVAEELLRRHGVDPLAALLVGRGDPEDHRVRRPRLAGRALVGRPRHDLQLGDRRGALPDATCRGSRRRCRRRR